MNSTPGRKRRRLKKPVRIFLRGIFFLAGLFLLIWIGGKIFNRPAKAGSGGGRVEYFRDINEVHLRYARARGITPLRTGKEYEAGIDQLVRKKKLVKISDSKYFTVNKLTHSYPYLVPEAARLLDLIGDRFQTKLKKKEKYNYLFRITSVLRTNESQKRLRRSNTNATSSLSSHVYGTSFDISYKNLVKKNFLGRKKTVHDPVAIRLLSETIGELRKENKLVVVTEKREACFHITVR